MISQILRRSLPFGAAVAALLGTFAAAFDFYIRLRLGGTLLSGWLPQDVGHVGFWVLPVAAAFLVVVGWRREAARPNFAVAAYGLALGLLALQLTIPML